MNLADKTSVHHKCEVISNEQRHSRAQHNRSDGVFFLLLSTQGQICGTKDLSQVTSLELCVDTGEYTLGNFGKICSASRHMRQMHDGQGENPETNERLLIR